MESKQNLTMPQSLVYMNIYTLLRHGNAQAWHGLVFESPIKQKLQSPHFGPVRSLQVNRLMLLKKTRLWVFR